MPDLRRGGGLGGTRGGDAADRRRSTGSTGDGGSRHGRRGACHASLGIAHSLRSARAASGGLTSDVADRLAALLSG